MMNKVIVDVEDVQAGLSLGRRYGVSVKAIPGGSPFPHGNIEITGDYGSVLAYLIDGLAMSDDEAELIIQEEERSRSVQDDERTSNMATARTAASGRQFENFDKFMDRIVLDEHKNVVPRETEKSPQRIRAERNQDRPNNRIRYGRTK